VQRGVGPAARGHRAIYRRRAREASSPGERKFTPGCCRRDGLDPSRARSFFQARARAPDVPRRSAIVGARGPALQSLASPQLAPVPRGARRPFALALSVALGYLALALPRLSDYGPTWDLPMGDYPYGERLLEYLHTGDERFLDLKATEPEPPVRAPHPDFEVGRFQWFQISPVAALLSAASCRLLWTELGLVPAMAAHHLPGPLLAAALAFALTLFCARRHGGLAGVVAGGSLALDPVFFGHSTHNLKDAAECCFYAGAVLAGFVALQTDRTRWWLSAGALTALALAQKPNALFLPVQLVLFLGGARALASAVSAAERPRFTLRALAWTTLAFVVVYYAVSPAYWTAPVAGPRRVFEQILTGGTGPRGALQLDAPLSVLITTPPITLLFALLGVLHRGLRPLERFFLVLGAGLPVARNLLPGMRHYDGTRHFLEFLPMLCALSGGGAAWLLERSRRFLARPRALAAGTAGLAALALLPCFVATASTHPNQLAYFNALVGGLGGAQRRGIPDAADCRGDSYWQGLQWLSEHAEPGASLLVPVADHLARSAAPVRLRPDIRLLPEREWGPAPLYVMYLTLPGRYGLFVRALERDHAPLHEIRVQGGVVLRVHRLPEGPEADAWHETWKAEIRARGALRRVMAFLRRSPEVAEQAYPMLANAGREETFERLRALLPAELHAALEDSRPMLERALDE
jgi:hypothetical protein